MSITPEKVAELEAKHGKVLHLRREAGEAVFRRPKRDEWRKFKADLGNDEGKHMASENLVIACAVWPERAQFEALLDDAPGLIDAFANGLTSWSGLGQAETVKK